MDIQVLQEDDLSVAIKLIGSLNFASARQLDDITEDYCARGYRQVVLSLELLHYVNSAGLAVLLKIAKTLVPLSGPNGLALCAVNDNIRGILKLCGLLNCVAIYDDITQVTPPMQPGLGIKSTG